MVVAAIKTDFQMNKTLHNTSQKETKRFKGTYDWFNFAIKAVNNPTWHFQMLPRLSLTSFEKILLTIVMLINSHQSMPSSNNYWQCKHAHWQCALCKFVCMFWSPSYLLCDWLCETKLLITLYKSINLLIAFCLGFYESIRNSFQ